MKGSDEWKMRKGRKKGEGGGGLLNTIVQHSWSTALRMMSMASYSRHFFFFGTRFSLDPLPTTVMDGCVIARYP